MQTTTFVECSTAREFSGMITSELIRIVLTDIVNRLLCRTSCNLHQGEGTD